MLACVRLKSNASTDLLALYETELHAQIVPYQEVCSPMRAPLSTGVRRRGLWYMPLPAPWWCFGRPFPRKCADVRKLSHVDLLGCIPPRRIIEGMSRSCTSTARALRPDLFITIPRVLSHPNTIETHPPRLPFHVLQRHLCRFERVSTHRDDGVGRKSRYHRGQK